MNEMSKRNAWNKIIVLSIPTKRDDDEDFLLLTNFKFKVDGSLKRNSHIEA